MPSDPPMQPRGTPPLAELARMNKEFMHPTHPHHSTDGLDCWCRPRYGLPCEECGDMRRLSEAAERQGLDRIHATTAELAHTPMPCWKCDGGLIYLTRTEAEACGVPLVVVHNQ